jgi:hypothetical protein
MEKPYLFAVDPVVHLVGVSGHGQFTDFGNRSYPPQPGIFLKRTNRLRNRALNMARALRASLIEVIENGFAIEEGAPSAATLKFRSVVSAHSPSELQSQSRTRIKRLLVLLDSEVRKRGCRDMVRTSESEH